MSTIPNSKDEPSEYSIKDLLDLVVSEKAERLICETGAPPSIVVRGDSHMIEGPSISLDNTRGMFRCLADSRQMREFENSGTANFIHTFQIKFRFLVEARLLEAGLRFEISPVPLTPGA